MSGTETVSRPSETVRVLVEMGVGEGTAVKRPREGGDMRVTRTLEPSACRPVSSMVLVPDSSPKTTLTILRVGSYEANPSSPVCPPGVVVTMLPAMSPYHLYSHH